MRPAPASPPKAKDGDLVVIDFLGKIDGEPFEGGAATDAELVIGSGRFIPGFEEQLIGAKPGAKVTVKVSFPDDYQVDTLKGKAAEFDVESRKSRRRSTPRPTTSSPSASAWKAWKP